MILTKIATKQKTEGRESLQRSGARGEARGGWAVTGSDEGRESALLAAVSFMSETEKDSQRKR